MKAMLRPGLALYGLAPEFDPEFEGGEPASLVAAHRRLQPVLTWKTQVVGVRDDRGGRCGGLQRDLCGDGADDSWRCWRWAMPMGSIGKLGNRFSVLVRGQRAPLVGRISMDQAVIDVTEIAGVEAGDEVVLLGAQGAETISAFDHARAGETIPWEVFTRIGARVARVSCRTGWRFVQRC